jgi:hypothetical protein
MIAPMPRDGAIIFSDLIGKLDVLRVTCEKCGREVAIDCAACSRPGGPPARLAQRNCWRMSKAIKRELE